MVQYSTSLIFCVQSFFFFVNKTRLFLIIRNVSSFTACAQAHVVDSNRKMYVFTDILCQQHAAHNKLPIQSVHRAEHAIQADLLLVFVHIHHHVPAEVLLDTLRRG